MEEKKLYSSLKRLQNFPLDLTCVYETKKKAIEYCSKKNSKAYPGQTLAVWNDGNESGIYIVAKDKDGMLYPESCTNKKELEKRLSDLKEEITNDITKAYEEYVQRFTAGLSGKIDDNTGKISDLDKKLTDTDKKLSDRLDDIDQLLDDKIEDNLEDLKDALKWIKDFIKDDGTLNSLGSIKNTISDHTTRIGAAEEKISALDTRANQTDGEITELGKVDEKLQSSISKNAEDITAVESKLPITYRGKLSNTTKISEGLHKGDEIEEITITVIVADSADEKNRKVAGFKAYIDYNGDKDILISADESDYCDYIDITTPGTYKYFLNYPLTSVGSLIIEWTDNTEEPTFEASYNAKIIKNIIEKQSE